MSCYRGEPGVVEKLDLQGMGDRIRLERARLKISQHELATRAGVAAPTVANLELGKPHGISLGTVVALARALGDLSLDYLVFGHSPRERLYDTSEGG